jgi:hypothetical protein
MKNKAKIGNAQTWQNSTAVTTGQRRTRAVHGPISEEDSRRLSTSMVCVAMSTTAMMTTARDWPCEANEFTISRRRQTTLFAQLATPARAVRFDLCARWAHHNAKLGHARVLKLDSNGRNACAEWRRRGGRLRNAPPTQQRARSVAIAIAIAIVSVDVGAVGPLVAA